MERNTLEQQLFLWVTWDEMDQCDLLFYDITLLVPVGEFPVGTKFESAVWLLSQSLLCLMDQDGTEHAFELKVSVGDKVVRPLPDEVAQ
jgi:hypothetical protein